MTCLLSEAPVWQSPSSPSSPPGLSSARRWPLVGWFAFFVVVASGPPLVLVALPIWVLTALVVGLLANALTETERALAARDAKREELRRPDELKSGFIALASHELRSPAAAIYGISVTLEERGNSLPPEQVAQLRRALHEQSERLRRLVDQLLDLSRLEAEAIEIRPEPLPVRSRVEEIVRLVAGERAGDVRVDVPPELEAIADANAFDRIVSNLVANAVRYGDAPITVAAEQRDRHFRLAVEDRGPGVPPHVAPQLFERFVRSEASRAKTEGAGLGLSIAQAYAHCHGGDVFYEPARPHGARFELVLPRSPQRRDAADGAPSGT